MSMLKREQILRERGNDRSSAPEGRMSQAKAEDCGWSYLARVEAVE